MLALIAALVAALWAGWQNRRSSPLAWSMAAAAGVIAGHSLIDFDFSYLTIWLVTWALLAAATDPASDFRLAIPVGYGFTVTALGIAVLAGVLGVGQRYVSAASDLVDQGKVQEAAILAERALRYDRWDSKALQIIGGLDALERAVKLDPRNAELRWMLAIELWLKKQREPAFEQAREAVRLAPMVHKYYTKAADTGGTLMVSAIHDGNIAAMERYAEEVRDLGDIYFRSKASADAIKKGWMIEPLKMEPVFQLRYGQALYLASEFAKAEKYLKAASGVGLLGSEADVWLYRLYEKRGDKAALAKLENKPWIRFRRVNPVYKYLSERK